MHDFVIAEKQTVKPWATEKEAHGYRMLLVEI